MIDATAQGVIGMGSSIDPRILRHGKETVLKIHVYGCSGRLRTMANDKGCSEHSTISSSKTDA